MILQLSNGTNITRTRNLSSRLQIWVDPKQQNWRRYPSVIYHVSSFPGKNPKRCNFKTTHAEKPKMHSRRLQLSTRLARCCVHWDVEAAGDRLGILTWTIEQRPQTAGSTWRGRGSDHRPPAPAAVWLPSNNSFNYGRRTGPVPDKHLQGQTV